MNRKIKISDKWETVEVKQPMAIHKYNAFMNGVDKSDQILNTNNVLRKCVRWWKTLFFHMIDIALVNGYILFQSHRRNNPDNELLKRPQRYCLQNFREVVQSLAELEEYGVLKPKTSKNHHQLNHQFMKLCISQHFQLKKEIVKFATKTQNEN